MLIDMAKARRVKDSVNQGASMGNCALWATDFLCSGDQYVELLTHKT